MDLPEFQYYENYKFKFYEDPGHAWLEVPIKLIKRFCISKEISSCSYINGTMVYLEEDCDAPIFMKMYEEVYGKPPSYTEQYQEYTPIRTYKYYNG